MPLTITHLVGPLAGQKPQTFADSQTTVTFGRSHEADVTFPSICDSVGGRDIELVRRAWAGTYEIRRSGEHFLEINGDPIPTDQNNIPVVSGTLVRLGGKDGPLFKVEVEKPKKGPLETAITKTYQVVRPITQQLEKQRHILSIGFLAVGAAILGILYYELVYLPNHEEAIIGALLKSTYLVVKRDEVAGKNNDKATATAFAVALAKRADTPPIFATNAHVTEAIRAARPGSFYLLGPEGKQLEITSVETHPAYRPFQLKKWTLGRDASTSFTHLDLPSVYDVGIIRVDPNERLPDQPLTVVDDLRNLKEGTKIVAAGYPSEGILGADNLIKTMAKANLHTNGNIESLKDVFHLGTSDNGKLIFVEHNVPATGGMSGSPIVDAWSGELVAIISGGNITHVSGSEEALGDKGRSPNAAMVNFAQRADLVTQMLNGTAAKQLPAEEAYWNEVGKKWDQYDAFVRAQFLNYARENYDVEGCDSHLVRSGSLTPTEYSKVAQWVADSINFEAEPGHVYGFLAQLLVDPTNRVRISLRITQAGKILKPSANAGQTANTMFATWNEFAPTAWVAVDEPKSLEVRLGGNIDAPAAFELYAYSCQMPSFSTTTPVVPTAAPKVDSTSEAPPQ